MAILAIVHCTQILKYVLINVKCQLFLFWIHSRQFVTKVKWNVYHISENSLCCLKQNQFVLKGVRRDHLAFFCHIVIRSYVGATKYPPMTSHLWNLNRSAVIGWKMCTYKVEISSNRCTIVRRFNRRKLDGMNNKCAGCDDSFTSQKSLKLQFSKNLTNLPMSFQTWETY